ncbi:enoyl-CoA hydratase/isomerase family protein [Marinobacter fonticola]|uniref:enoyl-CoA hydratase/isomerase family protein n=1 Tax=Marinobacter fonticola TaxID=2603215 RepID=UPI0011E78370|nr:enoyl-CoA hydratase-related protein [Marinobacter fonticola]
MIEVRQEGGLVHLTIARADKKNALTRQMYADLANEVDRAAEDDTVHAIVITGEGGVFTAGNDLDDFRARAMDLNPKPSAGLAFIERLMVCDTPIIAGVEGLAIGIGTTMLMHCDVVIAGESALFRTPFVDLGLCPEAASTVMMPLQLGYRRATDLLIMGESITGQASLDSGIASQLVPDGAATEEALATGRKLGSKPRDALRASKRLLKAPWREQAMAALEREREAFGKRLQSPECQHALKRISRR